MKLNFVLQMLRPASFVNAFNAQYVCHSHSEMSCTFRWF